MTEDIIFLASKKTCTGDWVWPEWPVILKNNLWIACLQYLSVGTWYLLQNDGHHSHCSFSSWIPFKAACAASEVAFLWERFCIYSSAHVGVSSQGKQNRIKRLGSPDAKTATVLRVCNQIIQRGNFMQGLRTIILPKRGQSWCCRAQDFDSRPLQSALGRSICQPHRL